MLGDVVIIRRTCGSLIGLCVYWSVGCGCEREKNKMRLARRDERESRENGEKVIRDLVPIIKCLNDLPKGWGKGEKDKEEIRLKDIGSHFHGIGIVGDGK